MARRGLSTACRWTSRRVNSSSWSARPAAASRRLLRMIAGLEDISGGEIAHRRQGHQRRRAEVARHRHGVPELRALPAYDGAREHGLRADAEEARQGRDRRTRSCGRRHPRPAAICWNRYPRQLSGGQRQRVAMGRAIVRDPKVFLFDEPLSNLDAKLRVQMRTEIKALHQRLGTTIVYVTHDQVEAMTMADKIVVMNGGIVEQVGAPARPLRPSGQSVRRPVHRLAGDEHPARPHHGGTASPPATARCFRCRVLEQGESALAWGIRPEHLRLADSGVPAVVEVVEPTGVGNPCHGQGRQQHAERTAARAGPCDARSTGFPGA